MELVKILCLLCGVLKLYFLTFDHTERDCMILGAVLPEKHMRTGVLLTGLTSSLVGYETGNILLSLEGTILGFLREGRLLPFAACDSVPGNGSCVESSKTPCPGVVVKITEVEVPVQEGYDWLASLWLVAVHVPIHYLYQRFGAIAENGQLDYDYIPTWELGVFFVFRTFDFLLWLMPILYIVPRRYRVLMALLAYLNSAQGLEEHNYARPDLTPIREAVEEIRFLQFWIPITLSVVVIRLIYMILGDFRVMAMVVLAPLIRTNTAARRKALVIAILVIILITPVYADVVAEWNPVMIYNVTELWYYKVLFPLTFLISIIRLLYTFLHDYRVVALLVLMPFIRANNPQRRKVLITIILVILLSTPIYAGTVDDSTGTGWFDFSFEWPQIEFNFGWYLMQPSLFTTYVITGIREWILGVIASGTIKILDLSVLYVFTIWGMAVYTSRITSAGALTSILLMALTRFYLGYWPVLVVFAAMMAVNYVCHCLKFAPPFLSLIGGLFILNYWPVMLWLWYEKVGLRTFFDIQVPSVIAIIIVLTVPILELVPLFARATIVIRKNLLSGKIESQKVELGPLTRLILGDGAIEWKLLATLGLQNREVAKVGDRTGASWLRGALGKFTAARILHQNKEILKPNGCDTLVCSDARASGYVMSGETYVGNCQLVKVGGFTCILTNCHVAYGLDGELKPNLTFHFPGQKLITPAMAFKAAPQSDLALFMPPTPPKHAYKVTIKPGGDRDLVVGYTDKDVPYWKIIRSPVGGVAPRVNVQPGMSGSALIDGDTGDLKGILWAKIDWSSSAWVGLNPFALATSTDMANVAVTVHDVTELRSERNDVKLALAAARRDALCEIEKKQDLILEAECNLARIEDAIMNIEGDEIVLEHKLYLDLVKETQKELESKGLMAKLKMLKGERQQALEARNKLKATDTSLVTELRRKLKAIDKDLNEAILETKSSIEVSANAEVRMPDTKLSLSWPIVFYDGQWNVAWSPTDIEQYPQHPSLEEACVTRVVGLTGLSPRRARKVLTNNVYTAEWAESLLKNTEVSFEPLRAFLKKVFESKPSAICEHCARQFACDEDHEHDQKCRLTVVLNAERHAAWCGSNRITASQIFVDGYEYYWNGKCVGFSEQFVCKNPHMNHTCVIARKQGENIKYSEFYPLNGQNEDRLFLRKECLQNLYRRINEIEVPSPETDKLARLLDEQNSRKATQVEAYHECSMTHLKELHTGTQREFEIQCLEHSEEVADLKEKIGMYEEELTRYEEQITRLDAELTSSETVVGELTNQLDKILNENQDLQQSMACSARAYAEMSDDVKAKQDETTELKARASITESLQLRVWALEQEKDHLMNLHKNELEYVKGVFKEKHDKEIKEAEAELQLAIKQLKETNSELVNVAVSKKSTEESLKKLSCKVQEMTIKNSELQSEIARLEQENSELTDELDSYKGRAEMLNTKYNYLVNGIGADFYSQELRDHIKRLTTLFGGTEKPREVEVKATEAAASKTVPAVVDPVLVPKETTPKVESPKPQRVKTPKQTPKAPEIVVEPKPTTSSEEPQPEETPWKVVRDRRKSFSEVASTPLVNPKRPTTPPPEKPSVTPRPSVKGEYKDSLDKKRNAWRRTLDKQEWESCSAFDKGMAYPYVRFTDSHATRLGHDCGCHDCKCVNDDCQCPPKICIWCNSKTHFTVHCENAAKRTCPTCQLEAAGSKRQCCFKSPEACVLCGGDHHSYLCLIRNHRFENTTLWKCYPHPSWERVYNLPRKVTKNS